MSERTGNWCQTFSGRAFWPLDPRPEDISIEDIAHALGHQCRFGGHCRTFYSIAQHSVLVSEICDPVDALAGLLHDAAEAYVGDMVRPLKIIQQMEQYRDVERRIQDVILRKFGLPAGLPKSVHIADEVMLATEARDLMAKAPRDWELRREPHPTIRIVAQGPLAATSMFERRLGELLARAA